MSKGSKRREGTGYAEGYDAIDWGRKDRQIKVKSDRLETDVLMGQQRTGWPAGLLQDDSYALAHALSSKPDARQHVRDVAAQIAAEKADAIVFADEEPLENICKHCKFLERNTFPHHNIALTTCVNPEIHRMVVADSFEEFDPPEDFGCNRFEPKQT